MGTLSSYRAIMSFSHVIFTAFFLTFFVVAAIKETEKSDITGELVTLNKQESDSTGELVTLKEQGTQPNERYLENGIIEQLMENVKKLQKDVEELRRSQKEVDKRQILCKIHKVKGMTYGDLYSSSAKSYPIVTFMPYYRNFKFNPMKVFVDQIKKIKMELGWLVFVTEAI